MISKLPVYFCFLLIFDIWPSLQLICPFGRSPAWHFQPTVSSPQRHGEDSGELRVVRIPHLGRSFCSPLGLWDVDPGSRGTVVWLWHLLKFWHLLTLTWLITHDLRCWSWFWFFPGRCQTCGEIVVQHHSGFWMSSNLQQTDIGIARSRFKDMEVS